MPRTTERGILTNLTAENYQSRSRFDSTPSSANRRLSKHALNGKRPDHERVCHDRGMDRQAARPLAEPRCQDCLLDCGIIPPLGEAFKREGPCFSFKGFLPKKSKEQTRKKGYQRLGMWDSVFVPRRLFSRLDVDQDPDLGAERCGLYFFFPAGWQRTLIIVSFFLSHSHE